MSEGWHYLAFGMELGPMSWDDLRQRAARGDLRPDNRVRQGAGVWTLAGEIPGLFSPHAAERSSDESWYCQIFGAELGPMPWDELRLLAERGNLKGDNRVRRGDSGEWISAASLAELAPLVGAVAAETDFEWTASQQEAQGADDAEDLADEAEPEVCESAHEPIAEAPKANEIEPVASAPSSVAAAPKASRREAAAPKPAANKPRRQPVSLNIPYRLLGGASAAAGVIALVGFGYMAYLRPSTRPPDYRQVATAYRQVYDELKQFREAPRSRSPAGIKFQFSRSVAALRQQFAPAAPDSPAAKLGLAGAQLTEMLNSFSAVPGTPEASKFAASEQQFLKIIDEVAVEAPK